jgi:hypothetical protein
MRKKVGRKKAEQKAETETKRGGGLGLQRERNFLIRLGYGDIRIHPMAGMLVFQSLCVATNKLVS